VLDIRYDGEYIVFCWLRQKHKGKRDLSMLDSTTQNDLLREVAQLPPPLQRKVVEYAHSLTESAPRGISGDKLLRFAGTLSEEEAKEMMEAVKDCRRIDPNEW